MIPSLPARARFEECARYIHHVRRTSSLVIQRRTTACAKAAHRPSRRIFEACDLRTAVRYPEATSPTAHVSRVRGAMRVPTRNGMIVPSPASWKIYFHPYLSAKTFGCHGGAHHLSYLPSGRFLHVRPQVLRPVQPCVRRHAAHPCPLWTTAAQRLFSDGSGCAPISDFLDRTSAGSQRSLVLFHSHVLGIFGGRPQRSGCRPPRKLLSRAFSGTGC
jgi:hypothetical protein